MIFPSFKKFLLTRLMRGVTLEARADDVSTLKFLLTRLMRGVTVSRLIFFFCFQAISTHTPHARRDERWACGPAEVEFLLTRLMRGVTTILQGGNFAKKISTHTPHARRDWV